jgi:hypothetical protein
VKIPIPKILSVKTKGVIQLAIAAKVLFLALQIRICLIIESITKMINNDKINFTSERLHVLFKVQKFKSVLHLFKSKGQVAF